MSKGGCTKFFPGKLRVMLDEVEGLGLSHGSSWVSEGRAFAIHDPDVFMSDISPQFFDKQTHLRSFHRQLSIWGFTRLETGAGGRGVWFHKYFIRDMPELVKHIKRVPVKNPKNKSVPVPKNKLPDYTGYKLPVSISQDPARPKVDSKPLPVQPNVLAATAAKDGLAGPNYLPMINKVPMPSRPLSIDSLSSSLGHMPAALSTSRFVSAHHNTAFPVPVGSNPSLFSDQARSRPSFLTGYQPSALSSMARISGLPSVKSNSPPTNNLSDVARQLLSCRYASCAPPSTSLGGGSSNLNAALLAMIMETRNRSSTSNPGTGLSQNLPSSRQDQGPTFLKTEGTTTQGNSSGHS